MDRCRAEIVSQDAESIVLRVQAILYAEEIVMRTAHRFTGRCHVHLERVDEHSYLCRLRPKLPGASLDILAGNFQNEMLDEALRAKLRADTDGIRRLILAQAFSKVNLVDPELDGADPRDDVRGIAQPDPDPRRIPHSPQG